jgi:glycosyltransferase involved in cell wall biosynthesis
VTTYIDVSAAVHGRAGLGRYAENLARALIAKDSERFALFFNHSRDANPLTGLDKIPMRTVRAGYKPWRMAVWLGQLVGLGFDRLLPDADLYHATEHLLMPLRRVPTVLTVHDLIFRLFPQYHKPLNYRYLNAAMPLYCRRASGSIAVSQGTKNDLVRLYNIDPSKISVVHEAAAPHFTPAASEHVAQVRTRYRLPDHYLLHVGTIEPRKNLSLLLDALQRLQNAGENIHLVLVGNKGWLYQGFFERMEELGIEGAVQLLGYVPDADLPAIYSGARLVVVPSLYEGFGLPVLEAMACGVPVTCSQVSSLPEVGGDAVRYFDATDAAAMADTILTVWRDQDLRHEMSQQGLDHAGKYSWQQTANKTLSVYEKIAR